jgi:SAM-dependent methyltransferase
MARWKKIALIAGGVLLVLAVSHIVIEGLVPIGQTPEGHLRTERIQLTKAERLLDLINPSAGKTVVDMGAGYGLYTFSLAERVGPKGLVYATDIDSAVLAYLQHKANEKGYAQVRPVGVRPERLDRFYKENRFDIALMSDAILFIHEPEKFFTELRPSIAADGRLWISDPKTDPDFTAAEFPDPGKLRQLLRSGALQASFVNRLPPHIREMAARDAPAGQPDPLPAAMTDALNAMLNEPCLWQEAYAMEGPLSRPGTPVREALRHMQRNKKLNPQVHRRASRLLNRMIILDPLQLDLWTRAFAIEALTFRDWAPLLTLIEAGYDIPAMLGRAGYELVKEHDALPYHTVFEFRVRGG